MPKPIHPGSVLRQLQAFVRTQGSATAKWWEETEPAVEEVEPAVEETEPAVEEVEPAVEETEPAVEEVEPAVEVVTSSPDTSNPDHDSHVSMAEFMAGYEDIFEPLFDYDEPKMDTWLPTVYPWIKLFLTPPLTDLPEPLATAEERRQAATMAHFVNLHERLRELPETNADPDPEQALKRNAKANLIAKLSWLHRPGPRTLYTFLTRTLMNSYVENIIDEPEKAFPSQDPRHTLELLEAATIDGLPFESKTYTAIIHDYFQAVRDDKFSQVKFHPDAPTAFLQLLRLPESERFPALKKYEPQATLHAQLQGMLRADKMSSHFSALDFSLQAAPDPDLAGTTLTLVYSPDSHDRPLRENFHVVRKLGEGSFGTVYLALGVRGNQVAIKILKSGFSDMSVHFRDAVLRHQDNLKYLGKAEPRTQLIQPAIVKGDIARLPDDGRHALVMKYYDYGTLADLIEFAHQSEDPFMRFHIAADFCVYIGTALRYLARNQIIHADVKATNVLIAATWLSPEGQYTPYMALADFDLNRMKGYYYSPTNPGTPAYRAPEISVPGSEPTVLSDLFSVGATLYHIFAQHPPDPLLPDDHKDLDAGIEPLTPDHTRHLLKNLILAMMDADPEKRNGGDVHRNTNTDGYRFSQIYPHLLDVFRGPPIPRRPNIPNTGVPLPPIGLPDTLVPENRLAYNVEVEALRDKYQLRRRRHPTRLVDQAKLLLDAERDDYDSARLSATATRKSTRDPAAALLSLREMMEDMKQ